MPGGARYVRHESGGRACWGVLDGDTVAELAGPPFGGESLTGKRVPAGDVRLLAPAVPSKVIAVGMNYRSHLWGRGEPAVPGLFAKLPSSVIGPGAPIRIPADATEVHAEGELVVVIGCEARNVSREEAGACIFGVTAGNDVSERGWQRDDLQWLRAKGADTFGPLGPHIATGLDWDDLQLRTRLNGEVVQEARTSDLIFSVPEIVSYISRYVTLLPGDAIFTGTPGTTASLSPGDRVEVEVESVGILENPVERG